MPLVTDVSALIGQLLDDEDASLAEAVISEIVETLEWEKARGRHRGA